ncbi:MAG: hypothetical protein ACOCW6_10565, partial [Spirochaetota bacterium]
RNEFPAFEGEFSLEQEGAGATIVRLSWENNDSRCTLTVDLRSKTSVVEYRGDGEGAGEFRRRKL